MILTSTLAKDKGLRSVINKLVVQVGAKLGMVPWSIDNVPLNDKPTMLMGIDVSGNQTGGKDQAAYGMTATVDPYFCQYWSQAEYSDKDNTIADFIYKNMSKAIQNFFEKNEVYPQRIIVFREGVSSG